MDLFSRKSEIIEFYQSLINDPDNLFLEDTKTHLKQTCSDLEREQFSIVVAGRFSAGKSLLINRAFLRADILPYKNEPVTCHPVHIVFGEKNQLILRDNEGKAEIVAEDTAGDNQFKDIGDALKKYGAQYGDDHDRYQHFELKWNDPEILKKGIVLVDTIGTEDTEERYIQKTFAEMERGSAILFLFNMKQAGTGSERDFIEKYMSKTGKKLFIILNRSDQMDSDEERDEVLVDFKKRFQPFFKEHGIRVDDRIFMVSAKTGQGLGELRQRLVDFIANDRIKELLRVHTHQLKQTLDVVTNQAKSHLQDLQKKKNGDEQELREKQKQIEGLEEDLSHREGEIEMMKEELIEEAKNDLKDKIDDLKDRMTQSIRNADKDELQDMITDMLERLARICEQVGKKLQGELRKHLDKAVRRWLHNIETDEMSTGLESLNVNRSGYDAAKLTSGVSGVGGVVLMGLGAIKAFGAYTTTATVLAGQGALPFIGTWFVGGAAAGPILASVTAAAPFIAGGLIFAALGYVIYQSMEEKGIQHNREQSLKVVKEMFKNSEKEIRSNIQVYVNEQIDTYMSKLKNEASRQKHQLESVIKEKDIQILQGQIDDYLVRENHLNVFLGRLNKLIIA
jgi:predicted GTPase